MHSNELIQEDSPYLLHHAHNPVNWMAWSEKALLKAKEENKLIFLSIGYSTCHWCHVMEHEVFENPQIAAFVNQHFQYTTGFAFVFTCIYVNGVAFFYV